MAAPRWETQQGEAQWRMHKGEGEGVHERHRSLERGREDVRGTLIREVCAEVHKRLVESARAGETYPSDLKPFLLASPLTFWKQPGKVENGSHMITRYLATGCTTGLPST